MFFVQLTNSDVFEIDCSSRLLLGLVHMQLEDPGSHGSFQKALKTGRLGEGTLARMNCPTGRPDCFEPERSGRRDAGLGSGQGRVHRELPPHVPPHRECQNRKQEL